MKKIIFAILFAMFSLCSYAQMWDIIEMARQSKEQKQQDAFMYDVSKPLIDSYVGKQVRLKRTYNVYLKFNFRTKDTKKEIDGNKLNDYVNRIYTVEQVVYDVEDFLGDGYLFVLRNDDDEEHDKVYVQRSYRSGLDGIESAFDQVYYSKEFFDNFVYFDKDPFEGKNSWVTYPITVYHDINNTQVIAAGELKYNSNNELVYIVGIGIASSTEMKISDSGSCDIVFANSVKKTYNANCQKSTDLQQRRFNYYAIMELTPQEYKTFCNAPIHDIRIGKSVTVNNISIFYATYLSYVFKSLVGKKL